MQGWNARRRGLTAAPELGKSTPLTARRRRVPGLSSFTLVGSMAATSLPSADEGVSRRLVAIPQDVDGHQLRRQDDGGGHLKAKQDAASGSWGQHTHGSRAQG